MYIHICTCTCHSILYGNMSIVYGLVGKLVNTLLYMYAINNR